MHVGSIHSHTPCLVKLDFQGMHFSYVIKRDSFLVSNICVKKIVHVDNLFEKYSETILFVKNSKSF